MDRPRMTLSGVVLGTPDVHGLAEFYTRLLGWERRTDEDDWVVLQAPDGPTHLAFQYEAAHVPPVWPAGPGDQQMMLHLDIQVDDLDRAVKYAEQAGARVADFQPQDDVRVCLDPAGHPFCLWV